MANIRFFGNITPQAVQFENASGTETGRIGKSGDDLTITNAVGDVLFGDGLSDVYIGNGLASVDLLFEQSGSISGASGSSVTLTLGSSDTTLNVYDPQMANGMTLTSTMTMGAGSTIDYLPDTGVFLKFDGQTILERTTVGGALTLGHDDGIIIAGGDTSVVLNANVSLSTERVTIGAEAGLQIFAFPNNDVTWSNRQRWNFSDDGKLYFGTADDTNLYRSAANTLKTDDSFLVGGNVGIGTTVPTSGYKLDVAGSILSSVASGNTSVVVSTNNANGAINAIAGQGLEIATDGTNKNIAFRNGTSTSMYIKNGGNVGIGTTSPGAKLSIAAGASDANTEQIRFNRTNDEFRYNSIFSTISSSSSTAKISFGVHDGVTSTSQATVMSLLGNGNVGIGTTSPGTKLHIVVSGGSSQLTLERTGGGAGKVVLAGAVEGLIVYDDAYGPKMYVGTSGTYNGNVGIGTITPSQKLHVSGSARVTGAYYDSGNSAGTAGQVLSSTATGTGWVDATTGDITGVTATSPLTGGGTSGAVTVGIQTASASQAGALSAANWTTFNNKTSNTGTVTSVGTTGTVSGLTLTGTVTTSGNLTLGGTLSLTSANVTTGLGFTPYNATNPAGYTANTGTTTAANTQTFTNKSGSNLQWTNDAGYLTSAGDITGVTAGAGLSGGGVTGTVTVNVDYAGTDNIILTATNAGGTTIEDGASIMFSDDANNVKYAQIGDLPFGTSNLAIGTTSTTAKAGNITTISTGQASAITTNSAKVGITTTQATAITNNTAKVGITTTQASNITTNNAKVGITTTQANAITANTAKVGITTTQASDITANNAKTGITSAQASAITANTAKVTDTGRPAIESDGTEPSLTSGMTAGDIRALIGAGTSSLAIGTGATNALRGDTTTISTAQATAITNNTAKVGITTTQATAITNNTAKVTDTGTPAILSDGSIPTLNSGITGAEVRTLIGAGTGSGTSNLVIGTTASTAMAGNTTTITTTQASDITTNNAKTGITSAQATAITNNTAKVTDTGRPAIESDGTEPSLTSGMTAGDIRALIGAGTGSSDLAIGTTASTAMAGDTTTISSTQASDITANNSKVSDTGTPAILSDGSVPTLNTNISAAEVRGLIGAGTSSLAIGTTASTAKAGDTTTISTAQAAAITANTAKVTDTGKPAIESDGTEPSLTSGMTAGDIRALIGAGTGDGTSDLVIGTGATNALRGDTTTITTTQAANIVTNNAKVSNVTQTTVSGNAGSATILQNARTIAGVSFNGSANISLNNNAITNGAGYTTNTGDITGVTAGTGMSGGGNSGAVTLNCTIDTPGEVGLGNLSSSGNALEGSFTATGDITAYSDKRLKTNIETISGALEKVNALRGVTFDKDGKRGLGVIAQEVEKILPEVVLDGEEYKSVAYGNIVGVLIEAVKEQQKQINELKERLDGFTK
jgi:trimeric autotransporter adhesin